MDILGEELQKKFPLVKGAKTMHKSPFDDYINRTWKPTLTVVGADGLPPCDKAGNVLRPETTLKLSFRLPPTKDPAEALKTIKKILSENPPYGAEVSFSGEAAAKGWACSEFPDWLVESLNSGSEVNFEKIFEF